MDLTVTVRGKPLLPLLFDWFFPRSRADLKLWFALRVVCRGGYVDLSWLGLPEGIYMTSLLLVPVALEDGGLFEI